MKVYEHEESPHDDIFKGVKTYEEVLDRVQTLPSNLQTSFLTFQKVFPRYCREKQQHLLQNKKTSPQVSDRNHRIKQTPRKIHRGPKDLHKTKKSHRQRIQEQKQKEDIGHLPSPVNILPLHHLLFMLIHPRQ
jgi:hypothetical protein